MEDYQSMIELFQSKCPQLLKIESNEALCDLCLYGSSTMGATEIGFRSNFNVGSDETVLYTRDTSFWSNKNQGMCMTDLGIRVIVDNDYPDQIIAFPWTEVETVDYKNYVFRFWPYGSKRKDEEDSARLYVGLFIKNSERYASLAPQLVAFFNELAACAKKIADNQYTADNAIIELKDLCEQEDFPSFDKAEELFNKAIELATTELHYVLAHYRKGLIYHKWAEAYLSDIKQSLSEDIEKDEETKNGLFHSVMDSMLEARKAIKSDEVKNEWLAELTYYWAYAAQAVGDNLRAVKQAIFALPYSCDDRERNNLRSIISYKYRSEFSELTPDVGYGIWGISKDEYCVREKEGFKRLMPGSSINCDTTHDNTDEFIRIDEELNSNRFFSNRPYNERKFIFITRDVEHIDACCDFEDNINYVFPIDEIPRDITFPFGHPLPNMLYYAHPLKPYYMPFEKANMTLFYEKVHEICRLFQCLGAVQITTTALKGHTISESINMSRNGNIEGGNLFVAGDIQLDGKSHSTTNMNNRNEMSLTQTFEPTKKPYCPEDLLWTTIDPSFQTLIHQRLEGGLLTFSKKVSSFETLSISNTQLMDVKATFETFMSSLSGNYNSNNDTTFTETTETIWEISVRFKPIQEFVGSMNETDNLINKSEDVNRTLQKPNNHTPEESEYLDMLQDVLAEGEITARERKLLEKLRVKLGISEDRAKELEDSLSQPQLSEEEIEYLNEYRDIVADGEVTPRERKLLDKICKMNGISPERAKELEAMA